MRIFLYSHDSMGLGSLRRQLAIATALAQSDSEVRMVLATSIAEVSRFHVPLNCEIVKLSKLRKNDQNKHLDLAAGRRDHSIHLRRSAQLSSMVRNYQPSLLLVDKHPFGVNGELLDALGVARSLGVRLVLGMRDLLDDRDSVLKEWAYGQTQDRIAAYFDLMLIYGSPLICNPINEYHFPLAMVSRAKFCGYVVNKSNSSFPLCDCLRTFRRNSRKRPMVLAMAGGGKDGFCLLHTFIQAAKAASWHGLVIVGPFLCAQDYQTLRQLAVTSGITLRRFIPNLSKLLSSVDVIVCMGGYNTLGEVLSRGIPTICVPRIEPRSEQLIRATAFERLHFLNVIKPDLLSVTTLSEAINQALNTSRSALLDQINSNLRFDGAFRAAHYLLKLCINTKHQSLVGDHIYE